MSAGLAAKSTYVALARGAGHLAGRVGLLGWLDRRTETSRTAHWVRSLFAIHDLQGIVELDVPWWTYGAIAEVEAFLRRKPHARVFEYGSGASTVWLARRAGTVVSIEHHAEWYARVRRLIDGMPDLAEVELKLVGPDEVVASDPSYLSVKPGEAGRSFARYAMTIEDSGAGEYDLIVIDGRARAACLNHAVPFLAPGGLIVFDNSHRKRYRAAIERSNLGVRRYAGLTPALPYPDETSLLSRNAS